MIKKILNLSMTFLLLLVAGVVYGQNPDNEELKVLFVGNSYTYFWNLPQTVEAMATSNTISLTARKSTAGGTNWKQHWEGDKGLKTIDLIKNGDWDIVILQNHSKSTIDGKDQFMEYGAKLIELVKSIGAKPVLYETWAREFNPLMMDQIKVGYHELAERHGIEVVHVGEIWASAQKLRPEIRLYDPDMSHPSTIGTYLTACTFYSFLTKKQASGLEKRISKTDEDGELLYLSIMSAEDAEFLQQVVDDHFKEQTYKEEGDD